MEHLVPDYDKASSNSDKQDRFIFSLSNKMSLEWYGKNFSPFPLLITESVKAQIKKTHDILIKAIKSIVEDYLLDETIQSILPLTNQQKKLIALAGNKPYQIFSIRPDFLISENSDMKICEINARFTLNGFISSHHFYQQIMEDHNNTLNFEDELSAVIDNYLSGFDLTKPLFLLRDKEQGYDLNTLKDYLLNKNIPVIDIKPSDLALKENHLIGKDTACEQIIMELHQSELEEIEQDIIEHILLNVNYVNDIRTIMIAHDKRLLVCLSSKMIMSRYLSDTELWYLHQHIIPTYLIDDIKDEIIENKNQWVLKKCLSGKGEGMFIGLESEASDMAHIISELSGSYIAQPYLKQKKIAIFFNGKYQTCRAVGMILSLNEFYQGTGYFRTSPERIIALSKGGCAVATCFK
ncbi:hypothetical protein [Vibrio caribbeanicus]|uniref:Glutathionylspermidine synthase pre-ATP-grasp-like domain-containing protein n=1 Tax=Vibrio caribbeanicus ATCC BAA-2122 TaxID=796620 RepID=E3BHK2_9VIBR|nr:hypothetical protein [Vibrio caribbeanicus]EFP97291.1 hypothetical protein VIBC2010_17889 [Vibrio caribbeanicus ATCC BAA-2122]